MKATGVVRRVDDLGRIVIPKEIRRTMRIRESEPMEIFIDSSDSVIFKKYSPMGAITEIAGQIAEVLSKETDRPCVVCDRDSVIAAYGAKGESKHISPRVEEIINDRKAYRDTGGGVELWEGGPRADVIHPVITGGDLSGCVALLATQTTPKEEDARLTRLMASLMAKQMED